jgi:hypothetical protein
LKRILFFLLFLILPLTQVLAQYGKFFLSHHQTSTLENNLYFDIAQAGNGLMYIASKSGILEFDGTDWNLIKTPGAIYTVLIEDDEIFVGGRTGFGILTRNQFNQQQYQSLSDELSNSSDIIGSLLVNNEVYFISSDFLFVIDRKTKQLKYETKTTSDFGEFINVFQINEGIYLQTERAGLKRFNEGKLNDNDLSFLSNSDIVFVDSLVQKNEYIIYTASDSIYLLKHNDFQIVNPVDAAYLSANVVIGGVYANQNLLALATLRGGVVFIDPTTGETIQILNYQSGLPDNEVLTINKDLQSSIWVAHNYGFTRIMPGLPIRSFSHYPGLNGNLKVAKTFDNKVYVGTSLGLYRLDKIEKYDEVVDYIRYVPRTTTSTSPSNEVEISSTEDIRTQRRRGLLSFLKKKNQDNESELGVEEEEAPAPKAVVQKRVRKQLRSVDYSYTSVAGISGKIDQLIPVGNKLMASGTGGLYLINPIAETTEQLTGLPIRYAYYFETEDVIFAAGYHNDVLSFEKRNNKWVPSNIFDDFKEHIVHIFADNEGRIWFSGLDRIYWIYLKRLSVLDMDEIFIDNPFLKQAYGINANNEIYFVSVEGLKKHKKSENKLDPVFEEIIPYRVIPDNAEIWMSTSSGWLNLRSNSAPEAKRFLNIFKSISHINRNSIQNEIWIITNENELYRYNTLESFESENYFPLLVKQITFHEQPTILKSRYSIEQHEIGISISFVQPDFSGLMAVEYRYKLEGSGKDWSEWSGANNLANFTFLPVGDYQLFFESKDAFGTISSAEPIFIQIDPPYWRQTWFYAIEVSIFLVLVLLSIRLNRYGQRYRLLSRLLTFLTIVIFIEFIQTLAEDQFATEKSPVIDFLIQVSVAFMILPIESYLRNLMLRQDVKAFRLSLNLKRRKSVSGDDSSH